MQKNSNIVRRKSAPTICMQADIDVRLCSNLLDGENQSRRNLQYLADGTRMPDSQVLSEFCFVDINYSFDETER